MNKDNWPTLEAEISWNSGVLVDTDIRSALSNNHLVLEGNQDRAKYATYELVIGNRIEELVMDNHDQPQQDIYRVKQLPVSGDIVVLPGQTFKIFSHETLYMPSDVTAIAIPVGNLYKLGLHPETTFADPGFNGPFFVTICNYSPRIVKLKVGAALARLFFFKLRNRPDKIHDGHPRETPPAVERVPRPSHDALSNMKEIDVLTKVLQVVDPPHYEHAFVTNRIVSVHRAATDQHLGELRAQVSILRWAIFVLGSTVISAIAIALWPFIAGVHPTLTEGVITSIVSSAVIGAALWAIKLCVTWATGKRRGTT